MKLFNEQEDYACPPGFKKLVITPARKRKGRSFNGYYTVIARGPNEVGHRFMIRAVDAATAFREGAKLCRDKRLDFVAAFRGHMVALKYA